MLTTQLRLALRHLSKNRLYASINVLGLAVAVAAVLLIFRLVHYELSFDRDQPNFERIVHMATHDFSPTEGDAWTGAITVPAYDEVVPKVPQLEQFARVHSMWPTMTVPDAPGSLTGQKFASAERGETGIFTEPSFFQIFKWNWLAGDPEVLNQPNVLVLNETWAKKCFGSAQAALGKTMVMDNSLLFTVRGVVADAPANSDFQLHVIGSYETVRKNPSLYGNEPGWGSTSSNDQAYGLLRNASDLAAANQAIASVGEGHYNQGIFKRNHFLQPLSDVHFSETIHETFGTHQVERSYLGILGAVGVLILLMACFNFVNLATAQAAARSREVGVRKSLGSSRGQLVRQFMGETGVIVASSVVLGTALAWLGSPLLKHVSEVPDQQPLLTNPLVLGFLVLLTLVVSVLSGFYPALVLSGFEPVRALKNNITSRTVGGVSLRKVLVVSQFVIAQALIIGTLVTLTQMNFLRNMDMGFKPQLVYTLNGISSDSASVARFDVFKRRLQELPGVESVTLASDLPSSQNTWGSNFAFNSTQDAPFNTSMKLVDADYLGTYGLRLLAGRNLEPSDTMKEVLVNRTLLRKLGIDDPQQAIGQRFRLGARKTMPVVGVVEDFLAKSAHVEQEPIAFFSRKSFYGTAGVRIRPDNLSATVASIQQLTAQTFPEQVIAGRFFDERIAEYYRDEERFGALCKGFAALAILIACLGLYGLAALMAAQRVKEIGVRKVLGASVTSVVGLLSRDFLLLVLAAAVVAVPLAYWAMGHWLQDFVYRTPLSVWLFVGTVALACLVALLTVGARAWSAARANPVKSLRAE